MTNLTLNLAVLAVLGAVSAPVLRRLRGWPVLGAIVGLCFLTLVFDTLMIGVGLYVYDPAKITGVYLWGAPLEDFAYPIAAGIAMPVLWTVLGRRARRRSGAAGARGAAETSAVEGSTT
ncbi:MAG: lycopene cyclase domain-containing protein [Cellulomonas sp.]